MQFEFENIGDAHAYELRIETGVDASYTAWTSDPPPMEFATPAMPTVLPTGRVMSKTIPFARVISEEEFREIEAGSTHVYAYASLTYGTMVGTPSDQLHHLQVCMKYSAATTFFQATPFFNSSD